MKYMESILTTNVDSFLRLSGLCELDEKKQGENASLIPDTVMYLDNEIYVLDAKLLSLFTNRVHL